MGRPRIDKHKAKIYLTINEDVLNKARETINNISAFVETCLIKHIYSQQKKNKNSNFLGNNLPGNNLPGNNLPGSNFLGNNLPGKDLSEEELQKLIDSIEI